MFILTSTYFLVSSSIGARFKHYKWSLPPNQIKVAIAAIFYLEKCDKGPKELQSAPSLKKSKSTFWTSFWEAQPNLQFFVR